VVYIIVCKVGALCGALYRIRTSTLSGAKIMFYSFDGAIGSKKKNAIDKPYGAIDCFSWKVFSKKLLLYQKQENKL
jgi:hypothetical protein